MKSLHIQGAAGPLLLSAWSGEACAGVAHMANLPVLLQPEGFSLGFPPALGMSKDVGMTLCAMEKVWGKNGQQLLYLW